MESDLPTGAAADRSKKEKEEAAGEEEAPRFNRLFTYRYDRDKQRWVHVSFSSPTAREEDEEEEEPDSDDIPLLSRAVESVSVVSYNVLFDKFKRDQIATAQRLPHIFRILEESKADVITLQEVTAPFVRALMKQGWLQRSYFMSDSEHAFTVTPYGQLILSKFPFVTHMHNYSRVKRVVVAELLLNERNVAVPCVHLTSNYHDGENDGANGVTITAQEKRDMQMRRCFQWLQRRGMQDVVLTGDFNFDDEDVAESGGEGLRVLQTSFSDCWVELKGRKARGWTFDTETNPTAKITSGTGFKRKRYDRIMLRSADAMWKPESIQLLGTAPCVSPGEQRDKLCPSDHYGLLALLRWASAPKKESAPAKAANKKTFKTAHSLIASQAKLFDDEASAALKRGALQYVSQLLNGDDASRDWVVLPIGSYALDLHFKDSDIDVVCFGNAKRSEFFAHCRTVLRSTDDARLEYWNVIDEGVVIAIVRMIVSGVKMELQYCQTSEKVQPTCSASFCQKASVADKASRLSMEALTSVKLMEEKIAQRKAFRVAFLYLKIWLQRCGLYNSQFGFFGGYALRVVLHSVYERVGTKDVTADDLLKAFFRRLDAWTWGTAPIYVESSCLPGKSSTALRSLLRNATQSTLLIVGRAIRKARETVEQAPDTLWTDLLLQGMDSRRQFLFFSQFPDYVQITLSAADGPTMLALISFVQSKVVGLVVELERCVMSGGSNGDEELERWIFPWSRLLKDKANRKWLYSCCILVGVSCPAIGVQELRASARRFEQSLLADFVGDADKVRLSVVHLPSLFGVSQKTFRTSSIKLERPNVPNSAAAEEAGDAGSGEEEARDPKTLFAINGDKQKSADAVYNQIRWDYSLDPSEFVIGYEDRHVGLIEVSFHKFKPGGAVPWHRVRVFYWNGEIVWSRKLEGLLLEEGIVPPRSKQNSNH